MTKAIIVDDERKSREVLKSLLELYCPHVTIAGLAHDIPSALDIIRNENPELVFLDISLKDGDSFMILDQLEAINFNIIFITAFDEYSIKALNYSGIPCLFKPVDIEELVQVIEDVSKNSFKETARKYEYADKLLKSKFSKIPVLQKDGVNVLEFSQISSLEKDEEQVNITMEDGNVVVSQRVLKSFKSVLPSNFFYSINERLTINLLQVDLPPERFRNRVVMKNGDKFVLERSRNKEFWDLYKQIP
jgi:two-component system LytT family response regulator